MISIITLLSLALVAQTPEEPDAVAEKAEEADEKSDDVRFTLAAIPALAFNSDAGFGFGAIGSLFAFTPGYEDPYRARLTMQLFMTTRLIQDHNIRLDFFDIFDLPLRLQARAGYFQTITANYCGRSNIVTCDPKEAEQAANAAGLSGEARELFLRRYYKMRFIRLRAIARLRWKVKESGQHRIELYGGWRGTGYIHGDYVDEDGNGRADFKPFPGSRFAQDFPTGENGFASVLQAGIIFDGRDNEPSPRRGYWVEAHVRGATPAWLSTWTYGGANLTLRGYVPLDAQKRVVLTDKLLFDVSMGDMPNQEIVRVNDARDMIGFGGVFLGRGIREQRFVGKLKVINQTELRWHVGEAEWLGQEFGFIIAGLMDAGWIGREVFDFGGDPARLIVTHGGSFRIAWNKNFIVYADIAVSAAENYSPAYYINVKPLW